MDVSIQDFLHIIYQDVEGYIATALIGEGENRPINRHTFWNWPQDAEKIEEWHARHVGEDVYFTPRVFKDKTRDRKDALHTMVLYADTDEADPYGYDLDPSMVLETSPGRYQAYWCLDEPVQSWWAEEMSRRITYSRVKEGSDNNGWYAGKLLRLPYALNTKPSLDKPHKVTLEITGVTYTAEDIVKTYGDPGEPTELFIEDRPVPTDLPDRYELLDSIPTDPRLERALNVSAAASGRRSEERWFAECELFRKGFTAEEVFAVVKDSANDKYSQTGRPVADLWREVLRAEQSSKVPGVIQPYQMGYRPGDVPVAARPTLLDDDEHELIPKTFIDQYVAWAKTKTNADVGYHEFAAMCILSTIYGDFGYAVPQFGRLDLNLWFMIIGETTRSYKTTAKNLMMDIVRALETGEYKYDLGSDATSEGLLRALGQHPDRSVLMHTDETHRMLQAARGGKTYMSGFTETLTEIYDGTVRGQLRATQGKNTEASKTVFSLFLLGTPKEITSTLTQDDFGSGFLTRFLYVVGQPEPFESAYAGIDQLSEEATYSVDQAKLKITNDLLKGRSEFNGGSWVGAVPIRCTDEAWDRFNRVSRDLAVLANQSDIPHVLEPSANRMNKMILKLATLLSMHENKDADVELPYMLAAIEYAEKWYQHLLTVVGMVGLTDFGANVDALVDAVSANGKDSRPYVEVRRVFKNWPQRQWDEVLSAAQDQSLVTVRRDSDDGFAILELC